MNQYRRMRADQGLTLIELLVVIVILGILSAIIVFSVEGITDRGEAASCETSAQTIRVGVEAYYAQHAAYPDTLADLNGEFVSIDPPLSGLTFSTPGGVVTYTGPTTHLVTDTCAAVVGGPGGPGGGGPSVDAVVPSGPFTAGNVVQLSATTAGSGTVTAVEFRINGSPVGTDSAGPPWTFDWTAVPGNNTFVARATIDGLQVESAGVPLNVGTAPAPSGGSVSIAGLSGGLDDGETVRATTSGWVGTVTGYTYQWQRSGTDGDNCSTPRNFANYNAAVNSVSTTNDLVTANTSNDYCYRVIVTAHNGGSSSTPVTSGELEAN